MGAGTAVTVTGIVTWIKMENTLVSAGFASSCHHVTRIVLHDHLLMTGLVGAGIIALLNTNLNFNIIFLNPSW